MKFNKFMNFIITSTPECLESFEMSINFVFELYNQVVEMACLCNKMWSFQIKLSFISLSALRLSLTLLPRPLDNKQNAVSSL